MIANPFRAWRQRREYRAYEARQAQYTVFAADLTGWTNTQLIRSAMTLSDPHEAELCMAEWGARLQDRVVSVRHAAADS
ncbi:hypothetical protein [Nocardia sp. NBC_01327]|uniref:hypothetical protein n=1 Tax=Nocardia sp. NBC_01327 TaxID=2903593 RepID=UPI002E10DB7B|nr:hypothetical protein OG326_23735 [Nocardia sp. NBC_01327]